MVSPAGLRGDLGLVCTSLLAGEEGRGRKEVGTAGSHGWHWRGGQSWECLLCGCLASSSCLPEEMVPRGRHLGSDLQEGRYWELTDGSALADDSTLGPDGGLEEPTTGQN